MKVYFIGAGPGDPELVTLKGARILARADVVIYAGSLVNPAVLELTRAGAIYDSSRMTLEETLDIMERSVKAGKMVARLHPGDPSLYGAVAEQMEGLEQKGIGYEIVPGVSSFLAAAAALGREFTVPEVSQTVILTRTAGRTPVPAGERLAGLAVHRASMCIFLSAHDIEGVVAELGTAYDQDTPAAVVYKVSWPGEERVLTGCIGDIAEKVQAAGITRTALILVGDFLAARGKRSRLYDGEFGHSYRSGHR